ncbi:sucrose nonfermenting 4-like protein isoform X1 [Gossypium australe]|uniref:Sucrose nonfermenting 4-like protein isoform X1 n=1 Tax=Gossypium australe TaxID=47621 RepID=A0A5B6WX10_9ROSI|nr:sucrose nonfermenting 4-like protein isoform X1 [Gossypium australe]
MFGSDRNPARDAGRVATAGMVLLPIQFTWPHGGDDVSISGSFNGWTELVRMSQVEGCPNVFKAVCAVPHGSHEYKFFVDGEWRHDEQQPHRNGEYGIVNTFDTLPVPAEVSQHQIPAVILNQTIPRISEEDLRASRYQISAFLAAHTAYELLPQSGKVWLRSYRLSFTIHTYICMFNSDQAYYFHFANLDRSALQVVALAVDLPVKQAFHILAEQGIPVAPLWDFYKGKFVGVISASDFILILRQLGNHGSTLTEEELETHTISAWKEGKARRNGQVDGHGRPIPRHLIFAGPGDNLKDVALKFLQNGVATIPVIHSSLEDGVCRYFKHCSGSFPMLQLPIYAIPLGTWVPRIGESSSRSFAMLRPTSSLCSALNMLVQARVSSIPIVDDNDSLLDIYSRSDITALAKGRAYTHNLNEMTVYQALQLGQDSNSPYEPRTQRFQMCLHTDTLLKVMEQLANPGVRRLVIVEAGSNRVEGIISLSDVFRFLLG